MTEPKTRILHNITHKDLDGVACAIFVHEYCRQKNIEYKVYPSTYRTVDENFKNIFVPASTSFPLYVLTDITLVNEPLFVATVKNLLLIDHHPKVTPSGIKNKYVVLNKDSACVLTMEMFTKMGAKYGENFQKLAKFASDYDTWKHEFKLSKHLNRLYALYSFDEFFERFKMGLDSFNQDEMNFLKWKEKELRDKLAQCKIDEVADKVAFTVTSFDVDEIAEFIYTEMGYDYVFIYKPQFKSMSLRANNKATLDLGKIATSFAGGGGYPKAGAFQVNDEKEIADFIEKFLKIYVGK